MSDLNLGVIGNSAFGALIDRGGRVVWSCMPRFDSDPVFCSLLNGGEHGGNPDTHFGFFDIQVENFTSSEQRYLHNTAILRTTLHDAEGATLEITDFAPRFKRLDRMFRPAMMVRHVAPSSTAARAIKWSCLTTSAPRPGWLASAATAIAICSSTWCR